MKFEWKIVQRIKNVLKIEQKTYGNLPFEIMFLIYLLNLKIKCVCSDD